jgi:hypothetical protein
MGWMEPTGEHEGYMVGYVPQGWLPLSAAVALHSKRPVAGLPERYGPPLRELGTVEADREHDVDGVRWVGAACPCGWRSPLRELDTPLEWMPAILLPPPELETEVCALWRAHVVQVYEAELELLDKQRGQR